MRYDLYITQGEDDTTRVQCFEPADSPTAMDLTGWTAAMQIRQTVLAPDVLYAVSNFILASDGVTFRIPAADSSAWWPDKDCQSKIVNGEHWFLFGVYDLEVTDPDSRAIRLLDGRVWLSLEVTR